MKAIIRDRDLQGTSAAISAREYAMIKKERSRLVAGEYIFNFDPEDLLDLKKIFYISFFLLVARHCNHKS